jgi:hypothetical protein
MSDVTIPEGLGTRIIEFIIKSKLLNADCAHEDWHGTVTLWSSGAAEQIEAFLYKEINERTIIQKIKTNKR